MVKMMLIPHTQNAIAMIALFLFQMAMLVVPVSNPINA
jgi:hypothetical protein